MLEKFGEALKNTIKRIASAVFIDKKVIEDVAKQLKYSMLEADISLDITNKLIEKIKNEAEKNIKGIEKKEQLIKLIHDELTEIVGREKYELQIGKKKPFKIMLVGLYGSGKTTTASKLAFYYNKRGINACLLGLDVHRPAAPEQLEQLASKAKISCFVDKQEKNPMAIFEKFESKLKQHNLVIIDTAGRDVLNNDLIEEISVLYEEIKPELVILVVPADMGKSASAQALGFKKACNINGVIITRMDGSAKGGGALTSCAETNSNVMFIGTGEGLQDIESFNPSAFISRLLGLGDIEALIEKAKLVMEEKDSEKIESRLKEGKFTLTDLYEQIKAMQKMGPLDKIAEMIPGMGSIKTKLPDVFQVQENKLKRWKYAIDSMTLKERENPETLNSGRIARISKGSNVPTNEIREMIKQHKLMKEFVSGTPKDFASGQMDQKTMQKLAKKFGRKMHF